MCLMSTSLVVLSWMSISPFPEDFVHVRSVSLRTKADSCANAPKEEPEISWAKAYSFLFLHVGKAGGGSLTERLEKWWHIHSSLAHPAYARHTDEMEKTSEKIAKAKIIMINIRDPIDRYFSAFTWHTRSTCDRAGGDDRLEGSVALGLDKYCRTRPTEAKMLYGRWGGDASKLAEALYDKNETLAALAKADLDMEIRHASISMVKWMDFDWTNRSEMIYPIVMEKPFDLDEQLDVFVEWLQEKTHFDSEEGFRTRQNYTKWKDCQGAEDSEMDKHHSSGASYEDKNTLDIVNLARYFKKDYEILEQLKNLACKTDDCVEGIQSILDRRAKVLNSV